MEQHKHTSGVLRWSLIAAIVIVMNLFFNYAFSLVYPSPAYQDFFPREQVVSEIANQADCIAQGGQWNEQQILKNSEPVTAYHGYCDSSYTKQIEYEAAQKAYNRTIFIFLVVVGVLSIVIASRIKQELLSIALSWGGVLSLIIASMRYWADANNIVRVAILAVALGALIWTAIKKFS
ncbi:MAG: hypothetical protein V4478_01325 [Patescibacteria group bacterium]